ncbi:hypothetical protein ACM55H_11605 [Flavobacterium sp. ZT3R17]|uniref:hypothetical protein n=1 Tax=Flavobacterium cryoconiti TaxID=3398736 RepID=UPI003A84E1BD
MQRKVNNGGESPFLQIISKYWFVILALLLGVPYLVKYYKDAIQAGKADTVANEQKDLALANQNPTTLVAELNKVTINPFYHNLAKNVSIAFGTDVLVKDAPWYTGILYPMSAFENDEDAYNQLKLLKNSGQVSTVSKCYYILTRNDFVYDVKKNLDSQYLKKLPLFK